MEILRKGQNFGEMALIDAEMPLRIASVISLTTVSLAVLTADDYEDVCEIYP